MKKSIAKLSLAFVIIAALVLILVGLQSLDEVVPSYRFLGGRNPVAFRDVKTGGTDKCYTYSFEADFNDVCSNAEAELIGEGFVDGTQPGYKSRVRDYWLKNKFPRGKVWIYIHNNHEYIKHPDSKDGALGEKDGWIVVTIAYWRNWWWPF